MNDDDPHSGEEQDSDHSHESSEPEGQQPGRSHISALVPERVARGIFSTGAVVAQGPHEFIIDFLQRLTSPHQVAARVVMSPAVVARLIGALDENLVNYERSFGSLPATPVPVAGGGSIDPEKAAAEAVTSPSPQDLYDQLKLAEDVLSGAYANAVMIGHTASEFCFDFITTFYPHSAVSCRIYLAAPGAPRFLEALRRSYDQFRSQQTPPADPPDSDHDEHPGE